LEIRVNSVIREVRTLASFALLAGALASSASAQFSTAKSPLDSWTQSGSYLLATYQYDDGTSENSLGLTNGGDMGWMHMFNAIPNMNTIGSIEFTIGTSIGASGPLLGQTAKACIWDDPNEDGNPTDAVLLSGPTGVVVTQIDNDVFMTATMAPVPVTGKFFVGMVISHAAGLFPASMDTAQSSLGRAWVVGTNTTGAFNFANLGANSIPPLEMDSIGFPSVFLLRGEVGGTQTTPFCTPKASLVCGTPVISATGTSSATATSGFTISASPARNNKSGILLYNTTRVSPGVPFQGGTLCVDPMGLRRAGSTNSLGGCGANNCTGIFSLDINAFASSTWTVPDCNGAPSGIPPNNPAAFLLTPGTTVHVQWWGRDSVATGSYVSSGLSYVVGS
jgi:hypothetical protein